MNKIAHKEYKENEMRNYRKFDFASLRNSRLQNGFWEIGRASCRERV